MITVGVSLVLAFYQVNTVLVKIIHSNNQLVISTTSSTSTAEATMVTFSNNSHHGGMRPNMSILFDASHHMKFHMEHAEMKRVKDNLENPGIHKSVS
jgi:hypothetical protein